MYHHKLTFTYCISLDYKGVITGRSRGGRSRIASIKLHFNPRSIASFIILKNVNKWLCCSLLPSPVKPQGFFLRRRGDWFLSSGQKKTLEYEGSRWSSISPPLCSVHPLGLKAPRRKTGADSHPCISVLYSSFKVESIFGRVSLGEGMYRSTHVALQLCVKSDDYFTHGPPESSPCRTSNPPYI